MKYNSDDSDAESDKLPVASSPEDDFSTPLRKNITLTPSTLTYKMTESEPSKSSLKSRIGDLTKTFAKQTAKKSSVLFESQYSPEREAEIEEERKKAAVDFPNPIDDTLQGLSLTTIEQNETWYDIPSKIDSDKNKELATKERIRANVLKGQRRAFYTTITKMKNRIMRDNETTTPQEWRDIQAKCRGTFTSLTHITDELKHYGFQNSPQEIKSYTKYFSDLKTMLNKIDNIVDAEHDDELREAFLTTYLKEEDAFSKGISVDDLADDFNQTLGAGANSTQFKGKDDSQQLTMTTTCTTIYSKIVVHTNPKTQTKMRKPSARTLVQVKAFTVNLSSTDTRELTRRMPLSLRILITRQQTKETQGVKGGQEANRPRRQEEDNHLITTGGPHLQTCNNNNVNSGQDNLNSTPTTLHNPPPTTRVLRRFRLRSLTEVRKPTRDSNSSSRPLTSKIETFPIPIWH